MIIDPSAFRSDGSRKSQRGFLGPKENVNTGETMTEFSIGIKIDGEETEIPSMIPGLTDEEIQAITRGEMPDSIPPKAKEFALKRRAEGKPYFYQDGEELQEIIPTQRGQIPLPSGQDGFVSGTKLGNLRIQEPEEQVATVPATQIGESNYFSPVEEESDIALESDSFELSPIKARPESKPASEIYSESFITKGVDALQEMLQPEKDISDVLPFIPPPTRERVSERPPIDNRTPERIKADESFKTYYEHHKQQRRERLAGRTRSTLAGASFRWSDELESLIRYESKKQEA